MLRVTCYYVTHPIGVFDSGIGGLTVLREIVQALPDQSIVFLGDTARVPYGTRGVEVIASFADELADFLIERDVQYLVAACNTISGVGRDASAAGDAVTDAAEDAKN